jgi:hypothetical protein
VKPARRNAISLAQARPTLLMPQNRALVSDRIYNFADVAAGNTVTGVYINPTPGPNTK